MGQHVIHAHGNQVLTQTAVLPARLGDLWEEDTRGRRLFNEAAITEKVFKRCQSEVGLKFIMS